MAGLSVQVTVEDAAVRRALGQLLLRGRDLTRPFDQVGAMLVTATQRRFETQRGPDGRPWPRLAWATLLKRAGKGAYRKDGQLRARAERRIAGAQILRDKGQLYASLTHRASAEQVAIGTNKVYGRIHQFGGKAGRGHRVTLPARPYLPVPLPADDRRAILAIVLQHLREAIA